MSDVTESAAPGRHLCSEASQHRGEPVFGTASRVDRWILVESSGPWGQRALPQSRGLDEGIILGLQQRAKHAHARLLLIRKPGRSEIGPPREVYAADSRPDHLMLRRRTVTSDDELDTLSLPFDGETTGWQPVDAFIGVCTQGKHDTCCAVSGRPVVRALHESHPEYTYEVSHIGGDRFAANLLVLPHGHYLGRVPPEAAAQAIDTVLAGRRPSPYYRGRSIWSAPLQAAQEFAAAELSEESLESLHPLEAQRLEGLRWRVVLDGAGDSEVVVNIEQQQGPEVAKLTCHAEHPHAVPSWRLLDLTSRD